MAKYGIKEQGRTYAPINSPFQLRTALFFITHYHDYLRNV